MCVLGGEVKLTNKMKWGMDGYRRVRCKGSGATVTEVYVYRCG